MEQMTPEEILKLKHTEPRRIPVVVEGVPSRPAYMKPNIALRVFPSKDSYITPSGVVFRLGELECGVSYISVMKAGESLEKGPYDFQKFSLPRIKFALEKAEKENILVKIIGKYDTGLNILEVDYSKTVQHVEEVINKWAEKQQESIRLMNVRDFRNYDT